MRFSLAKPIFFLVHYATVSIMNGFESSIRSSLPLFLWPRWPSGAFLDLLLGLSQQFRFPTKPNPLANIIGEASPQGFQPYLDQTAQPKLTQFHFLFDPGVRKLCHPGALLVDLLGLGRLHLRFKRSQSSRLVHAQHRATFFTPRTTASLKRTAPALRGPRAVAPFDPAALSLLGFKTQNLAGRTGVTVRGRIIGKGLGIKLFTHSPALERIPRRLFDLSQGSNQIDALVCHRLDRGVRGISGVHDHCSAFVPG